MDTLFIFVFVHSVLSHDLVRRPYLQSQYSNHVPLLLVGMRTSDLSVQKCVEFRITVALKSQLCNLKSQGGSMLRMLRNLHKKYCVNFMRW